MKNCIELRKRNIETLIKIQGFGEFTFVQRPLTRAEKQEIESNTKTVLDNPDIIPAYLKREKMIEKENLLKAELKEGDNLSKKDLEFNDNINNRLSILRETFAKSKEFLELINEQKKNSKHNKEPIIQKIIYSLTEHKFLGGKVELPKELTLGDILDIISEEDFEKLSINATKLTYLSEDETEKVK